MTDSSQFQLFDLLDADEFEALKADIAERGVLVPIEFDTDGNLLDGHHRRRACDELGIKDYPTVVRHFGSDDEREEHIVTLNVRRRHLNSEQKRRWAAWFLKRHPEWPDRRIGREVGIDHKTATGVRAELEESGEIPHFSKREDPRTGNLSQPARKPSVFGPSAKREQAQQALTVIADKPAKSSTLTPAEARLAAARERKPAEVAEPYTPPDGTYSTIVVDPPWPMAKIERDERPDQGKSLDYPTLDVFCEHQFEHWSEMTTTDDRLLYDRVRSQTNFWCLPFEEDDGPCKSIQCVVGHLLADSAAENCHLYLWVTHRFLPDALLLLESWEFRDRKSVV